MAFLNPYTFLQTQAPLNSELYFGSYGQNMVKYVGEILSTYNSEYNGGVETRLAFYNPETLEYWLHPYKEGANQACLVIQYDSSRIHFDDQVDALTKVERLYSSLVTKFGKNSLELWIDSKNPKRVSSARTSHSLNGGGLIILYPKKKVTVSFKTMLKVRYKGEIRTNVSDHDQTGIINELNNINVYYDTKKPDFRLLNRARSKIPAWYMMTTLLDTDSIIKSNFYSDMHRAIGKYIDEKGVLEVFCTLKDGDKSYSQDLLSLDVEKLYDEVQKTFILDKFKHLVDSVSISKSGNVSIRLKKKIFYTDDLSDKTTYDVVKSYVRAFPSVDYGGTPSDLLDYDVKAELTKKFIEVTKKHLDLKFRM
jgi:hypothetical protein